MTRFLAPPFDPLQAAFGTSQELYKSALLTVVNGRRFMLGHGPVGWPAVGATPHDVVWSEEPARLLHYRSENDATAPCTPLLLVCSLINRPYILDLLDDRSVVRRLLDAGRDVWLLDWGTPRPEDKDRSLADYALGVLPRAAEEVCRRTGTDAVHVLGYCMGGTLALMAIAAGRLPSAGLVALATPVDFHDAGQLSTWCRQEDFDPDEMARAYGNLPPYVLQPAFKLLDPVGLATKMVHLDEKIADDDFLRFFLAMEIWLEDSVAFPGRAFAEWVGAYRSNALTRGKLKLDGQAIQLRSVRCPILNIVAEKDYITPPASSLALEGRVGSTDYELVRMAGGHIGLSTGGAAHRELWPRVAAWLAERDPILRARVKKAAPRPARVVQPRKKSAARTAPKAEKKR